MVNLAELKEQIADGKAAESIGIISDLIASRPSDDNLYYLRGNAYYKQGLWQPAINDYLEAIALNPESPAVGAYSLLKDILEFYNKDIYCQ